MLKSCPSDASVAGKRSGHIPGYVYFIAPVAGDLIKIGRAANPLARLNQLRLSSPERLGILAAIRTDHPSWTEADAHRFFAHLRTHGEWFVGRAEIEAWIRGNALWGDDLTAELFPETRPDDWRPIIRFPRFIRT